MFGSSPWTLYSSTKEGCLKWCMNVWGHSFVWCGLACSYHDKIQFYQSCNIKHPGIHHLLETRIIWEVSPPEGFCYQVIFCWITAYYVVCTDLSHSCYWDKVCGLFFPNSQANRSTALRGAVTPRQGTYPRQQTFAFIPLTAAVILGQECFI